MNSSYEKDYNLPHQIQKHREDLIFSNYPPPLEFADNDNDTTCDSSTIIDFDSINTEWLSQSIDQQSLTTQSLYKIIFNSESLKNSKNKNDNENKNNQSDKPPCAKRLKFDEHVQLTCSTASYTVNVRDFDLVDEQKDEIRLVFVKNLLKTKK